MAINFNELPSEKPDVGLKDGTYYAIIEVAEMKASKPEMVNGVEVPKPDYMNLRLKLSNKKGLECGTIFDIISESAAPTARYKLRRFIEALKIDIQGDFELKDLCKLVAMRKLIVDVANKKSTWQGVERNRVEVDIAKGKIYYALDEADEAFEDDDLPFYMGDEPREGKEIDAADAASDADEAESY